MAVWWKELGKGILRSSGRLSYIEAAARHILSAKDAPTIRTYEIPEIAPLRPHPSTSGRLRLNLLVPSINLSDSYGGILTALRVFERLGELIVSSSDAKLRIVTNTLIRDASIVDLSKWNVVGSNDSDARYQVLEADQTGARAIPISMHDVFVATFWPTVYQAERLRAWQERSFGRKPAPLIYVIQDFEPGFYPWSSRYAYAEATYIQGANTIAIFNSALLRVYFEKRGYSFLRRYHFEPRIDNELRAHLNPNTPKNRCIVVYGRPSSARNCFETICAGLKEWSRTSHGTPKWTIVSAGERHLNVPLENGLEIRSVGKLTLRDYAGLLNESAIGISLMLSPHPSYPPLDMAHAGVLTITNSYAGKDLSSWHENICSIDRVDPGELAKSVERCVRAFDEDNQVGAKGKSRVDVYLRDDEGETWVADVALEIQSWMRG